ncbi:thiol reductant ABC exporter subunit CydC [Gordonia sinesedis]
MPMPAEPPSVDGARGAGHAVRSDPLVRALGFLGLGWRPVLRSLLLGVGGALSALGLAALSAWLITRAWQMPPVLYLSVAITAVRALGISRGVLRYLERLATHDLALGAMATARERVYLALATGSPAYSVTVPRGALLARTGDDIDEIGDVLIRGIIPVGVGFVTSVAAVVIMALVSPWAAVVLAVALIVSGVVAPWLAARGSAAAIADSTAATARSVDAATTALWHAPELVVARRREAVLDSARTADREALRAADRGIRIQAAAAAATPLAMAVSLLAACLIGIHLAAGTPGSIADVASGEGLTPMILGVLILLPLSAFESTGPLTEAGIVIERGRQAAARLMGLVDGARDTDAARENDGARKNDGVRENEDARGNDAQAEPGSADDAAVDIPFDPRPVTVRTSGLRWGWRGRPVLGPESGLDLELAPGSRLAVVGPSGAGKSTLMLTLAGLLAPAAGTVDCRTLDGTPVGPAASVCYIAEEGHVFSTSVRENLLVARGDATTDELRDALAAVGLSYWLATLPDGLDTLLVGGADAISGGQRRRLLLARALLCPAPVVLLDEPTEHLDAADGARLLARLLDPDAMMFGPGRTVVVVTHHLDGVDLSAADIPVIALDDAGSGERTVTR